ncbi:hypothetical protein ACN47E_004292 [Coniothyrium glycines]
MTPQDPSPFTSQRLHYRSIRPTEDLPVFHAINNDPSGYCNSNFSNAKLPTSSDAESFLKQTAEDSLVGAIIWLPHDPFLSSEQIVEIVENGRQNSEIMDTKLGTAIGEIHLSSLPKHCTHHRHTEIGLDILPAYQRQGFGSEAILWAADYAFRRLGMHRVRIRAFGYNEGAVRLYEKLGFVNEGSERECIWFDGRWWDGIMFGLLEGEWEALRKKKKKKQKQELVVKDGGEERKTAKLEQTELGEGLRESR